MDRLNLLKNNLMCTESDPITKFSKSNLKNKVLVISGASRGIGLEIAKRAAKDGAKIAILAKTIKENPNLPGTIYTAAEEINLLGGEGLPIQCDIRNEESVKNAIDTVINKFGKIDILINNASAISLTNLKDTSMKKYDLINQVNGRGTYMLSKYCYPYLLKSDNPHILMISPPLFMRQYWFENSTAYTISKYNMSLVALGLGGEFRDIIGVNTLWPKTYIATTVVKNLLGGSDTINKSRKPEIMSDSAYLILTSRSKEMTGNFFIDENVLKQNNITDLSKYKIDKNIKDEDLLLDGFIN